MKVLSCFDGVSCGRVALERAEVKVDAYYASEIDTYATKISHKNYPDIIQVGDIENWRTWNIPWEEIDLILAGSPCQGFSNAGLGLNFEDPRSRLFFTFVDILTHAKSKNPNVKYILENVRMKKEYSDVISSMLGVNYVPINSALVSAQNRPRLYWCNFPVTAPEDKHITFKDIKESNPDKKHYFSDKSYTCLERIVKRSEEKGLGFRSGIMESPYEEKVNCIDANYHKGCDGKRTMIREVDGCRMLTPLECERAQTLPEGYTEGVSNCRRYHALGNGWTIDVIVHILNQMRTNVTT